MILSSKEGWKLDRFEPSPRPTKKIVAILKKGEQERRIHFGQKGSSTFHDKTGVGNDPTHNDSTRRANYRKRHIGEGEQSKKYSAGWLSWHYLW